MMNDIEYHKKLVGIIKNSIPYSLEAMYIEVPFSAGIKQMCQSIDIETETIQSSKLRLLTKSIKPKIFDSVDSFLKIKDLTREANILIFDKNDTVSYIENVTYRNFEIEKNNYLISNTQWYLEFLNFLKEQEKEVNGSFHFIDSYNRDLRKIILVSISEKSRLSITYDIVAPHFDNTKDLSFGVKCYKKCFNAENVNLPRFLKSATINIVSNYSNENRIKLFVENLEHIVSKAMINFEIYLNELSLDKIKKDYDEVKTKYFNSLSDILSTLTQNIIALPIAIAALLFAVGKIKEESTYLGLLGVSIIITTFYISSLLRVHFKDLVYTKRIFLIDYSLLIDNKFFKKYPEETLLFKEVKKRIFDRVNFLQTLIESYFWIMNTFNVSLIILILFYLKISTSVLWAIGASLMLLLAVFRNYILSEESSL